MTRRIGVVLVGGAVSFVACVGITGAGDLREGAPDGGGGIAEDGGSIPSGPAPSSEAGADAAGPPLPACGAGVCVIASDGWTPYAQSPLGDCPAEWPTPVTYAAAASMSCNCSCGSPTSGSCEGPLTVVGGVACGGPSTQITLPGDGECSPATLPSGPQYRITPNPTNPPAGCSPPTVTKSGGGSRNVKVCSGASAAPSAECKAGEVCVPRAPRFGALCVVHDGDVPCPAGFLLRTEIGTAVSDGRTCTPCTCAADCSKGTLEAYTSSSCSIKVEDQATSGSCENAVFHAGSSFRYRASSGCSVAQSSTVTGTATITDRKTLCCNPSF